MSRGLGLEAYVFDKLERYWGLSASSTIIWVLVEELDGIML